MVVDRGKSGAERLVETIQELPPMERFGLRRKSRAERLMARFQELPPGARVGLAAAATGLLIGVAFLARKRLFVAAAVVAGRRRGGGGHGRGPPRRSSPSPTPGASTVLQDRSRFRGRAVLAVDRPQLGRTLGYRRAVARRRVLVRHRRRQVRLCVHRLRRLGLPDAGLDDQPGRPLRERDAASGSTSCPGTRPGSGRRT